MKKIICTAWLFALRSAPAFFSNTFYLWDLSVSKDEFLRAYNKNKTPVTDKEKP